MSHVAFPIVWAIGLLVFAGIIAGRTRLLLAARPAARLDRIPERIRRDGRLRARPEEVPARRAAGGDHARAGLLGLRRPDASRWSCCSVGRSTRAGTFPGLGPTSRSARRSSSPATCSRLIVIVGVVYMLYRRLIVHTPRLFGIAPRRAALSRRRPLGGRPDPRLHPVHHGRRAAVRRRPPGRGRHPRQRARLRAADRAGGRGARRPQPLLGAAPSARSDGGCTASRSWSSCACCRCPSTSTSSPRSRTCSSASSRRAARSGRWRSRTCRPPRWPRSTRPPEGLVGDRLAGRRELEAGARRVLVHRVRPLHGRLPRHRQRHAAGAAAADPRHPRSPVRAPRGAAERQRLRAARSRTRSCGRARPAWRASRRARSGSSTCRRSSTCAATWSTRASWTRSCSRRSRTSRTQGNSYGKSARMRARWAKGLDFKIPDARKEPVEYVWFVGDFASFDERVQLASQTRRADPARRRRVVRAAVRGRAQRRQRRAQDRRGGPVRDAGRAEHGARSPTRSSRRSSPPIRTR